MAASIATLVKAITPNNAVAQSNPSSVVDPKTVHEPVVDPIRVTDSGMEREGDNRDNEDSSTYPIQELTSAFLDLAFGLRKPMDNKTRKTWESKFRVPECDTTRCPKLDTIIEDVVKKAAIDEDKELSRLQNFFLDAVGPLVAAFEELGKEEPDANRTCAAVQQALLLLGNASTHLSHVRRTKILKRLNRDVQSLAKDADFSQAAPYLFGEGIEQKIKDRMEAVRVLRRTTTEFKPKNFFREAPPKEAVSGGADSSHNLSTNRTPTQEVSGQEGPFRRQPQGVVDSEQYFRSPKRGYCFCNAKQSYRCITCNKFNKRLCTQYTKHPDSHSTAVGSAKPLSAKYFTGKQFTSSCRSFTPGCPKLDESNFGSLGHKHHSRVQDQILGTTPTDSSPHSASLLPEGYPFNDNRSSQTPPEGGNICGANNMHQGFSFQNISGSQKRRFTKTSNKPTPAEPICSLGAFQDGEHPLSGELNPGGGLDDKNGSKRCLLLHPNPPRTSSMATLPVATTSVPVSMSPLWPVLSTSGVHQSDTAHGGMVETTGNKNGCIHRRLPADGTHQGGSSPPSPINGDNISIPGIFNKHQEIPPNSTTGDRVLGSYDSVTPSSISFATTQAAKNQGQSYATSTQRCSQSDHNGQGDRTIHWNCQCCSSGNTTSSLVLQAPPGNQASLSKSREGTKQSNTLVDHRQGRAKLVERTSQSMEFSQFDTSNQSAQDNHRRIQLGMGGSLQRGDY